MSRELKSRSAVPCRGLAHSVSSWPFRKTHLPGEKMSILDRLFKFEYLFCAAVFYLALQTARLKEGPMPFSFVRNLMLGHKNSVQQSANSAQWIIIFLSDLNIQSLCTFGLLASVLPRSRSVALFLFQIETYGVYTKAFACRGWAVIKH